MIELNTDEKKNCHLNLIRILSRRYRKGERNASHRDGNWQLPICGEQVAVCPLWWDHRR
jgi:hypothetical protein